MLTDGFANGAAAASHVTVDDRLELRPVLTESETSHVRRVTVFAGGWTLASAEQVCVERHRCLGRHGATDIAVDRACWMTDEQAGATRYRMLETVRQYALDRLRDSGEESQWRGSHLGLLLRTGLGVHQGGMGPKQQAWLARIVSDHDNLRLPLTCSTEASPWTDCDSQRIWMRLAAFAAICAKGRE